MGQIHFWVQYLIDFFQNSVTHRKHALYIQRKSQVHQFVLPSIRMRLPEAMRMRAGCGRVPLTLSLSSCHRICPARHSPAPPSNCNWVQGGSNPFQGLILNRLFQLHIGGTFFIFKEEVQSNSSCYHPSECGRASWGRVVAGYAPNSPAPPPDYSFLDRVSARWRSESSTIQDTDQRQPELGESQEASLKI